MSLFTFNEMFSFSCKNPRDQYTIQAIRISSTGQDDIETIPVSVRKGIGHYEEHKTINNDGTIFSLD